jgi:hypothetical protein
MQSWFGEARFGQVCALALALVFVGAGTFAILNGHEVSGATVAVTGGGIGIPAIVAALCPVKLKSPVPPAGRQNPEPDRQTKKTKTHRQPD